MKYEILLAVAFSISVGQAKFVHTAHGRIRRPHELQCTSCLMNDSQDDTPTPFEKGERMDARGRATPGAVAEGLRGIIPHGEIQIPPAPLFQRGEISTPRSGVDAVDSDRKRIAPYFATPMPAKYCWKLFASIANVPSGLARSIGRHQLTS